MGDPSLTPGRNTLRSWDALGAHVDSEHLAASYNAVEAVIGVKALHASLSPKALVPPHSPGGTNGDELLAGWQALLTQGHGDPTFSNGLFRVNFTECLACGYCNFGCPYERRMAMLETYLLQAVAHGARLIPECHVDRINSTRGRAEGVGCTMADGRQLRVHATTVVVACGAVGSSVLLFNSGISRNVGSRFSCNIATPVLAKFPRRLDAFEGLQMTAYVDAGDFLLESTFSPPMAFAAVLPGWFEAHFDRMRDYSHFAGAGVVLGTEANGRIKRLSARRDLFGPVNFRLSRTDLNTLKRGMALLAQVHFAAGADAVYPGTFLDHEMPAARFAPRGKVDRDAIERHIAAIVQEPEDLVLNTAHPQGGNPMSNARDVGAVDSTFRVHDYANLFVCDASVFPTSIGINPQLTVMALADYAWRHHIATGHQERA
jgi:choline dehydrogenase-like flavoprotein